MRRAIPGLTMSEIRPADSAVEAAFAQVLAAEASARSSVEAARQQAAQIEEDERRHARARAERTRRRIAAIRAAFERRLQAELATMAEQGAALAVNPAPAPADVRRLDLALQQVATELTGGAR